MFFCFFLTGNCSTIQTRDLSKFPEPSRTLFLQNFTNETFQPDINQELTDSVREEILRRNNFIIQDNRTSAALGLNAKIIMYNKEGRLFDNFRNALHYELSVYCKVSMYQKQKSQGIREILGEEIGATVHYSETSGMEEGEYRARQRLFRILSMRINEAMERAFLEN